MSTRVNIRRLVAASILIGALVGITAATPLEATMGGAETMYPEYMLKLQQASSKPKPR